LQEATSAFFSQAAGVGGGGGGGNAMGAIRTNLSLMLLGSKMPFKLPSQIANIQTAIIQTARTLARR
jgi:hypothetical protein